MCSILGFLVSFPLYSTSRLFLHLTSLYGEVLEKESIAFSPEQDQKEAVNDLKSSNIVDCGCPSTCDAGAYWGTFIHMPRTHPVYHEKVWH